MGVDAYQTNQTSRTTFRASQSAAPVKVPHSQQAAATSADAAPQYEVPPSRSCAAPRLGAAPGQVPSLEQESHQILSRVDATLT